MNKKNLDRHLGCFLLLSLLVFTACSLWSFYPKDPSGYSYVFPQVGNSYQIKNIFGLLGAYYAGWLMFHFGGSAFLAIPCLCHLLFHSFLCGKQRITFVGLAWMCVFLGSFLIGEGLIMEGDFLSYSKDSYPLHFGGSFSTELHRRLVPFLGFLGLRIVGGLLILLALVLGYPQRQIGLDLKP